ncbi:hypothetical protein E2562_010801 [Oryza meyeriana var. granulata]|uniref:Uncharacterized protein n=1 Tax=Oryza meyeriana var. granulata TaxID=110450 RepID=A0A6G1BL00_9ORYZ|nr:hypothetical protein E2562_010801 [Oryza meyeriana var. granulata]
MHSRDRRRCSHIHKQHIADHMHIFCMQKKKYSSTKDVHFSEQIAEHIFTSNLNGEGEHRCAPGLRTELAPPRSGQAAMFPFAARAVVFPFAARAAATRSVVFDGSGGLVPRCRRSRRRPIWRRERGGCSGVRGPLVETSIPLLIARSGGSAAPDRWLRWRMCRRSLLAVSL